MTPELIIVKVSCPESALRVSSVDLVVIKLLLKRNGQKRKARLLPCYLKATKRSKLGHRKRMYDLRNEVGMPETEEQQLACHFQ